MSHFVFLRRKSSKLYIAFVILALQGSQFEAKRTLDIYVTLLSYKIPKESDAFLQKNCSLTFIEKTQSNSTTESTVKTHPAIYFSSKFAYDITDMKANVNISIERGGRYDSYLSTSLDICEMRYSKVEQPFIRFFRDELIHVLSTTTFCPIKKNVLFEVNNFMLSNSFLPAYAPILNWKADLKVWLNGRYSIFFVVMGKIEWINT